MSQITNLSLYCQYFKGHWKVVYEQPTKFLNDNILYKYQPGFRNNHSTDLFRLFLDDNFERFWQRNVHRHDSDWPAKSTW